MKERAITYLFALFIVAPVGFHYFPAIGEIGGVTMTLPRLFILLSGFIAVLTIVRSPSYLILTSASLCVFSLLILQMVSVAWSVAPLTTVRSSFYLSFFLIYFASIVIYFDRDDAFETFLAVIILPATIVVAYGLLNVFNSAGGWRLIDHASRNWVARDMVALIPILVLSAIRLHNVQTIYRYFLAGSMVVLVPLSGSRSGFVALLVAVLLTGFAAVRLTRNSLDRLYLPVGFAAVLALIGVITAALLGVFPSRLLQVPLISSRSLPEVLGQDRYLVRLAEISAIRDAPIFGLGYGAFGQISATVYEIGSHRAHSLLTRIWMGTGLVGFGLLTATSLLILRNYLRRITHSTQYTAMCLSGCLIGLVSLTVAGMFNIVILQPIFYLLVGAGASAKVMS